MARKGDERVERAAAHRFATLDLLRGLAACAILTRHFDWTGGVVLLFPRSYLAVDLFFVLSGFVLASAYQERLREDGGLRTFVVARAIRLYPLYILATLFGAARAGLGLALGVNKGISYGWVDWSVTVATAALFLPTLPGRSVEAASCYPLDPPAWSLWWELLVNLVYGCVGRWRSQTPLAVLLLIGAAWLAMGVHFRGTFPQGSAWDGALWTGGRALYSFFAGVSLLRLRTHWRPPSIPAWALATVLLLALSMPMKTAGIGYDLACVVFVFPCAVCLGAEALAGRRARAIGLWLGAVSYAIYVLQVPLLLAINSALKLSGANQIQGGIGAALALYAATVVAVAAVLTFGFDEPVRAWLRRRLQPGAIRTAAQSVP